MERNVTDAAERKRFRSKYFALYIFLLYKVFSFKMDYCKELIRIYANNFVSYAGTKFKPENMFADVTSTIVLYDAAYYRGYKIKTKQIKDRMQNAFDTLADGVLEVLQQPGNDTKKDVIISHIVYFIERVSARLGDIKAASEYVSPEDQLAEENMRASNSNPE